MQENLLVGSEALFSSERSLHQIFEHQSHRNPDATALVFDSISMPYGELNRRADLLAQHLSSLNIQTEDFVVIFTERSFEMITGIFGTLKAGGAYVPIDVNYPKDRIAFMLEDAQAKVILTQRHLLPTLPETTAKIICLDEFSWQLAVGSRQSAVGSPKSQIPNPKSSLAYMIYTSGSTGKPKGCMLTHENLVNQLEGQQAIAPDPIGAMLLTCSISFDVSVLTIFWTLLQGAPLILPKQNEEKDMAKLAEIIEKQQVTHILTLPSLHTLILEQIPPHKLESIQLVNVSGEVCPVSLAQRHEQIIPNGQLYNLYGPTEAAVNCTFFTFPKGYNEAKAPIGIPIKNYEIFILNDKLEEVPNGETGEIFIGGTKPVVGRGYWNRPELSAERFIQKPAHLSRSSSLPELSGQAIPHPSSLYKTGDLARFMPDGNIEFLGRADFQVKFRGYRIELGEVETAIGKHPSVKETVVILKNQHEVNNQRLVAYLTLHQGVTLTVSALRSFLEQSLPEYMLPSHFVFMGKMPLTTNGKFDRNALPEPPTERPDLAQLYEAPIGDLESHIADRWQALLQVQPIGRHDKFFELGGNSIQAAKFIGELMTACGASIFITTIFDYPTVASYAEFLEKNYPENITGLRAREWLCNPVSGAGQCVRPQKNSTPTDGKLQPKDLKDFKKIIPSHLSRQSAVGSWQSAAPSNQSPITSHHSPIFILAPPRSGTTLLRVMLAGHPGLFACNELQLLHFETLADRAEAYQGKFALWSEGLVRAVMELQHCGADEAKALLHRFEKEGVTTQEMFAKLQNWVGDRHIVDKSPSYALDLAALEKAEADFDRPLYIHLVRHPYSMVRSFERYHIDQVLYLKKHDFSARQLGELVWLESNRTVQAFLENIPSERHYRIVYEELVQNPEAVMRQMCDTLGLPFHEGLLDPYRDLDKKMTDGIYEDSRSMGDTHFDKQKGINAQKANDWKAVIEDNFLCEATWHTANVLGCPGTNTKLATKVEAPHPSSLIPHPSSDIAIIGMACRLPGANSLEEFYQNLRSGKDVAHQVTPEDLEAEGLPPEFPNSPIPQFQVRRTYALADPYHFDAAFFGYLPKEAALTDPQHRIFLETAHEALEAAGLDPSKFEGNIGIFGGVARNEYYYNNVSTHPDLLAEAGGYQEMLATDSTFSISRVAYKLNLRGPAVNVQTACSTGGVAVHLACQSLMAGDSDVVLVGGGRVQSPVFGGYEYVEGGPLSPDGVLRAFDANANGMVQGNGMAVLVLKKLDNAIADGDHIWAVIKASAINNDGSDKTGITAPSAKGQAAVIAKALEKAGLTADKISYVEAHGTGTFIGDPIEMQGLTQAFRQTTDKQQYCAIGSVKTNVGHLDAGACLVGIIKVALSLHHGTLFPTLHFSTPNPQIDFRQSPFFVNASLRVWERGDEARRAGVSSFGLGGTNAHVVLEEFDSTAVGSRQSAEGMPELLVVSAKTEEALERAVANVQGYLGNDRPVSTLSANRSLRDASYTLATGRQVFNKRAVMIAQSPELGFGRTIKGNCEFANADLVFLFPGGGAQYVGMAKDLYAANPFFQATVDECLAILKKNHGLDVLPVLFPKENTAAQAALLEKPSFALASLFTMEYSLAKLWQSWGIQPTMMLGHSMGEYAAACLAGVMSLEDALGLVTVRGQLFETLDGNGSMLSIALTEEKLRPFLDEGHTISVFNKPDSLVVSSTAAGIDTLQEKLGAAGVEFSRIHISVPAHSPLIDPILPKFRAHLEKIALLAPRIPFVSNVTGTWITPAQATSPDYWLDHLRQPVRFADGVATILSSSSSLIPHPSFLKKRIFLEVGPGQTLSSFVRGLPTLAEKPLVVASVRHPKETQHDVTFLLQTLGKLWVSGVQVDWAGYFRNEKRQRMPLPTYPFDRKKFFIAPAKKGLPHLGNAQNQPAEPTPTPKNDNGQTVNGLIQSKYPINFQPIGQAVAAQFIPPNETPVPASELTMTNTKTTRVPLLTHEIKSSLHDLSGMDLADMDNEASFLELGFDSLFLSQAVIKFNQKFGLDISFRALFEEAPTIEALAEYVDSLLPDDKFRPEPPKVQPPLHVQEVVANGEGIAQQTPYYNGVANGVAEQTPYYNGVANGVAEQNGHSNGHSNGAYQNGQGNGQPKPTVIMQATGDVQGIIAQQLLLMQQQLALLGGASQGADSSRPVTLVQPSQNVAPSQGVTSSYPLTSPEPTEIEIKRSTKGVTAKLNSYKKINSSDDLTVLQRRGLADFMRRYEAMTPTSKAMAERHRQWYADPRSVTGFSKLWKEIVYQIAHERSKGSRIWDVDGNEYVDYVMSYGVALFGHMPDFVQEAVAAALLKGNSIDLLPPEATDIARMICEMTGMERATLANTGTEAVLGAVRAARTATGRDKIAVFDTDYHGMIDQFMVRGVHFKDKTKAMPSSPGVPKFLVENTLVLDYDDPDVLRKLQAELPNLAAVVIEPVQAQNPHWQHGDLIKAIRRMTEEAGVALVFDEIINGFRLHQRGAQAWYGVEADICAYGKSISGGLPLAAIAGKAKFMDAFDGGPWQFGDDSSPDGVIQYYAGTFIKNPISVAAAYSALLEMERRGPALQEELNAKTARFAQRIREIFLKTKAPLMIQSASSFFMIKNIDSSPLTRLFNYFLREKGVNIRERPCFISTAHTEADFEKTYEAWEAAIGNMFEAGLLEPYHGEDMNVIVPVPASLLDVQSSNLLKKSSKPFHEPTKAFDEPTKAFHESSKAFHEPSKAFHEPSKAFHEPSKAFHEPSKALDEPSKALDESQINFQELSAGPEQPSAGPEAIQRYDKQAPLTEGQQEIFLSDQFSPDASKAYNIATEIRLEGDFDVARMRESLQFLVNRHEALRTTFGADGKLMTIVPQRKVDVPFVELRDGTHLAELYNEEAEHLFDLQAGPLARFKIVRVEPRVHLVFVNVHHIICDGWSLGILTKELGEVYGLAVEVGLLNLEGLVNLATPKQLSEYAKEQSVLQHQPLFQKNEAYWLGQFADGVPVLDLPTDFPRPPVKTYPGAVEKISLDPTFVALLRKTAARQGATFYIFMLAAFEAYLSRITGQEDFVVGVAAAGHNLPGNQNLVAHAIGLLPVRSKLDGNAPFKEKLKQVRKAVLDAFDHQQFTFGALVKKLKLARNVSRNTLVSVAFNLDSPLDDLKFGGLSATTKAIPRHYETFDTFINLKPLGTSVDFEWNFNTDLFTHERIQLRLAEFETFLRGIVDGAETPVNRLPLLPDFERRHLAGLAFGGQASFPLHRCLHELLEEQATKTPHKVAVVMDDKTLTYKDLNDRANALAQLLLKKGFRTGDFAGLCMERSPDLLVAIYGILKAGGAYVPIDPRNPEERIKLILEDAGCSVVVTESGKANDFRYFKGDVVAVSDEATSERVTLSHPLTSAVSAKDNAYVIYTSGSTGVPKGVPVRHENAVNTLFAINELLKMGVEDVVFSVSSMSFDMSIPDYFLSFAMGATLVLAGEDTKKDGFALRESLEKHRPTVMQATPTTWKILLLAGWQGDKRLRAIAGGEGFPKELARELMERCHTVWNGYGPTETTIYATWQEITAAHLAACPNEFAAIGRPLANVEMVILDQNCEVVPLGVPGELYIGGKGVTGQYLNRPGLSDERFLESWQLGRASSDSTFYKTGDLVRYLPGGEIEFLGRLDGQVKIRGFRVELGEIEETIKLFKGIENAAVTIYEDGTGSQQMVAYLVRHANNKQQPTNNEQLKTFLRSKLPGFMVPSIFVEMAALPMNTSLKVDRKALPKPDLSQLSDKKYEAPRTPAEQLLAKLWADLLGVEKVGIQDDFFEMGGHSLAAVQLLSEVKAKTGKKLPLTVLFQYPTIQKLAMQLAESAPSHPFPSNRDKLSLIPHPSFTSLIPIREGGSKPPLYLVHGGGLHVLFYQNLVKHLDADQPIFALQARGLNGDEAPLDRIEDMAAHYIQEILTQNPNGEYCLAGYSLGGLIAWEMAKQLKAKGKEVPMLALFDAVAKYEWAGEGSNGKWKKKLKKTGFNLSLLLKDPGAAFEYKSHVLKMQYQHLKGKLQIAYRNNATNEIEEGYLPFGKEVYEKSLEAYEKYKLQPLDIHVDLFKAKEQMFYLHDPVNYGWDKFAEQGVSVHEIEGNHLTLFDDPHGQEVAAVMKRRLEEVTEVNWSSK